MKRLFVSIIFMLTISVLGQDFNIQYEKYKLDNGLEVILHEDRSDPIVAVAILYHVGSNREEKGRTGFAHLFEHMLFQESQNVGQDQFFKKIQNAGGTLNGGTWNDGTIYFQVVPNNALEMVLWMESDRMGYLLPTVTKEAFKNQQEVVQNEKRQRVDNQPYGHVNYVIDKLLYPEDHPYNWQVIGSLEDLQNATIEDIHNFYKKWYGPNNATLVVAGDYDKENTKALVEKYFGELKPGMKVEEPETMLINLSETRRAYYEDNFAKSPQLNMVYPSVQEYHNDAYALRYLGELLSGSKKSPLYQIIVEEKKLAPSASSYQSSKEIAGTFNFVVRAFPESNLSDVESALFEALKRFEENKFTDEDLSRIKASLETNFYNGISSLLSKSFQLASYNEFAGTPEYMEEDLKNILAVSEDDIWRVYNKYIKGRNYVITSFVPKGKTNLAADKSEFFEVPEESIEEKTDEDIASIEPEIKVEPLPSSFDRSIEPAKGEDPVLTLPDIWHGKLDKGIDVFGIVHDELPLVQFSITLKGGHLLDDINKSGTASLVAQMLKEGTKNKTPIELEEAIDNLGATINVRAGNESITLSANCLKSKFEETFQIAKEILLEPRWDEKEFARLKEQAIEGINRGSANPAVVAGNVFDKLLYGEDHILSYPVNGTLESVKSIQLDDLKNYYAENFSSAIAEVSVAGDIEKEEALKTFNTLAEDWDAKEVVFPQLPPTPARENAGLYFVDMADAKQSEIRIGYLALSYKDEDYYPAVVMNYKLGGSFSGILNLILREEKGFTYGARSGFSGSLHQGPFTASAAVQSNATFESMQIFKDELTKYRQGVGEEDLEFTKNALLKSNARRFETLGALIGMLNTIAFYDLPADYIKQEEKIIIEMTQDELKALAEKYILPDKMVYLVVGDAKTQMDKLKDLGLGEPILLDEKAQPVEKANP